MAAPFDQFYFLDEDINMKGVPGGFCKVKFGDTRRESVKSGDRARATVYELHGNAQHTSVGKSLQLLLDELVAKGIAMQVEGSETYVVRKAMRDALVTKINSTIGPEGGRVYVDDLNVLLDTVFNATGRRSIGKDLTQIIVDTVPPFK
jgi:hypothetical protein